MRTLLSFAAAGVVLLAGGTAVQAQHGHGHGHGGFSHGHGGFGHGHGFGVGHGFGYGGYGHYHGHGHIHGHGHWLPSNYYGSYWGGYPYYGSSLSYPVYSYPSVVAAPVVRSAAIVASAPAATPVTEIAPPPDVTTSTSLKPNTLPQYAGPGVTLRLPAEFPGPVYVQVDKREVEIKPGTEVVLKDKAAYRVEFDRGGEFGTSAADVAEGTYKFAVGDRGWNLVPDTAAPAGGGLRRNSLPGEPKK